MKIVERPFGRTKQGEAVKSFSLYQADGSFCTLLSYGCIIQRLLVPDRDGLLQDVVLGFDSIAEYEAPGNPYHGAIVGRYAGRIENASFTLDGKVYELSKNYGDHHIHGGKTGFDSVVWLAEAAQTKEGPSVRFYRQSRDGEEGYPGNLDVEVTYTWTKDHALQIVYQAKSDRRTFVSLTNHSYFNLKGHGSGQVLDHLIRLETDYYTPADERRIPTGEILSVAGTPIDFRQFTRIGDRIDETDPVLEHAYGYDHNYVVRGTVGQLRPCAAAYDPYSGRLMEVLTTMPGVQFYTANTMQQMAGKEGTCYAARDGFCLETQHFPNAVRMKQFPSPLLEPDERYLEETVYRFSAIKELSDHS